MADINLRAQPLNVFGTVGDDMQIVLTVVDSAGDPIDVSGYTISAKVWRGATEVDEMTDAVSGASNNVITLSFTDTEVTAIGTERGLRWSLSMTTGGITEQWVGGKFELLNAGHPKASGVSAATLTYTSGDVTVTLGSISTTALDGRYLALDDPAPTGDFDGSGLDSMSAPDATTDTGVVNRQTADGRYSPLTALWLPGSTGNYVSTPDHADLRITNDLDIRWNGAFADIAASAGQLVGRWNTGSGNRCYRLLLRNDQKLSLEVTPDGGSGSIGGVISASALPAFDAWQRVSLRVAFNATTGEATFYYDAAGGTDWTAIASSGSLGAYTIYAGTGTLDIGMRTGAEGDILESHRVYSVQVLDGIAGTVVADLNMTAATGPRYIDSTGKVWTINGSGWAWATPT